MSFTNPIATRILAIPTSTDMSLSPSPPPPPPPSPLGPSDHKSDDESDDEYHDDDDQTASKQLQPSSPNTAMIGRSSLPSSPSTLAKSTISTASAALIMSSSSSFSTTSESAVTRQTTLGTSVTSPAPESIASSSLSQSDGIGSRSTLTSSTTTVPPISKSSQSSAATMLPIGRPDSPLETQVGSSPLGTAGIILAAIFGLIALVTTIYLLYRLRRRRQKQDSWGSDSEKWNPLASTAQETGVIFGRSRADSISAPDLYIQGEGRTGGRERSRFSFLNRNWYSTGTQFSSSQLQQQTRNPASHTNTINDTININDHSPSLRWPSPVFFSLNRQNSILNRRSSPLKNSQFYPSIPILATPQTATTITRLVADIHRNISTRSSGSGHARAYAHHGTRAPHSFIFHATRSTVCSISSLLIRARLRNRNSKPSTMTPRSPRTEAIGSPVSEISGLYPAGSDHSPRIFPPAKHHSTDITSSHLMSPSTPYPIAQPHNPAQAHWSTIPIPTSNVTSSIPTPHTNTDTNTNTNTTSPPLNTQPQSHTSFADTPFPQLPLPVAVSRGSWGSKITVEW